MATVTSAPAADAVAAIAAMANPVLRNLQITQCYAELSAAMRARTESAADWCTFATWASRQAGSTIRGEDLFDTLDRVLGRRSWLFAPLQSVSRVLLRRGFFQPDTRLGRIVSEIHTPFDAFERASAEVAAGNLKVFAEIGREFARFMATVPVDAAEDSPRFLSFAAGLRPDPPPDGQDYLREAFAHYQQQRRESDPRVRAAWILLANLKIGLHEQTRLQPQIVAAVNAPIVTAEDLGARVLHALLPGSRRWPRVAHDPLAKVIGWMAARVRRDAIKATQEVVTQALMVLAIPHANGTYTALALGRDLEAPVPEALATPHPFLEAFVEEYDPCPPGGTRCGAEDWCDIRQRMHYIVHLFRAYADEASLFGPPFSPQQMASFRSGVVPKGEL
ncbi:MAG TPA: hypothetical protein VGJ78_26345 [Vicinamibacterales bacterium]|jgi:hypothetical protein